LEEGAPLQGSHSSSGSSSSSSKTVRGTFEMSGAAGQTFSHPNRKFATWRMQVPISCGDWDLQVISVPVSVSSMDDFSAPLLIHRRDQRLDLGSLTAESQTREEEEQERERAKILKERTTPADVLWHFTNFGTLRWDWKDHPDPGAPRAPVVKPWLDASSGRDTLELEIALDIPPAAGPTDVMITCQTKLDELHSIDPAEIQRRGLINHDAFASLVRGQCDELVQLVQKAGAFGKLALPADSALEPITAVALYAADDFEREAIVATSGRCFHFKLTTS
jgi:hypothetical protein